MIQLSTTLRDAINGAVVAAGSGAVLNLYSGPEPATTSAPLTTSNVLLASIPCGSTFGVTNNGVLTFSATGSANQANALASGTVTFFRVISQSQGGSSGVDLSLYTLKFFDEFNGTSLDITKWKIGDLNGNRFISGNAEQQYYADPGQAGTNCYVFSNSILSIRASPTPAGQAATFGSQPYVSGSISTGGLFSYQYGYAEARIQVSGVQAGLRNMVTVLPADGSWPPEIDVAEVRSSAPASVIQTQYVSSTLANTNTTTVSTAATAYHTYGVKWDADAITWYIDGVQSYTTANQTNAPLYLWIYLAVGGNQAGAVPGNATWPQSLNIDYVRVYQLTPP